MYNFDNAVDRKASTSLKWHGQEMYGGSDNMLPYWIADTDFATVPEVMNALKERCEHPIFGYSSPEMDTFTAIQNWWKRRHGLDVDMSWLYPSYGVVTAIHFTLENLVPQGEKVLIFTPVYDPFFVAVEHSGHALVDCPLDYEDDYYSINWERFEAELKGGVKAVVFCNPHNPVGRVWTKEEMERLTDLCAQYDAFLLSDEIHADFGLVRPYTSAAHFKQIHQKLVVYTAISKSFNLAGLGSSCMFIPNPHVQRVLVEAYELRWMFGPTDFAYLAMKAAYTHGDKWMDEQCEYLRGNAELVGSFVTEHMPKIRVTKHEGTFLMWLNMTCFGMGSEELSKILAEKYDVALGIGSHYGKQADGFMRLNIGCTRSLLEQGLKQMEKMYRDYVK